MLWLGVSVACHRSLAVQAARAFSVPHLQLVRVTELGRSQMTQRPAGERSPDTDTGCPESPLHARLPLSPVVTSETLRGLQRTTASSAHAHLAGRSFMATGVSRVRATRRAPALAPVTAPLLSMLRLLF